MVGNASTAELGTAGATITPLFRRPTAEDALRLARETWLADERVDMRTLTAQLGVARTTLHRWVGTREALLDEILGELACEFYALARAEADGEGDELIVDVVGRLLGITFRFKPAEGFLEREPALAMRLLVGEGYSVRRRVGERLQALVGEALPDEADSLDGFADGFAESLVHVGTALEWSARVADDPPPTGLVAQVTRALLAQARTVADSASAADGSASSR
jgi:AcrR family transcriptional regulator